jgi:hypothetical protein
MRRPSSPWAAAISIAAALAVSFTASTSAETIQKGPARVTVSGRLAPKALPRRGSAPVAVTLAGHIRPTEKGELPELRRIAFAINSNGHLDLKGLPVCRVGRIQPASNAEALQQCASSLVGEGAFAANVELPEQSPFPSVGKMLAFNGRLRGRPAILAHIYGTEPANTSFTLPFSVSHTRGTFGLLLQANLPHISGEWGNITNMSMTLKRVYRSHGAPHSYISAGCPAPAGFTKAIFPLARTSFEFSGGLSLKTTLNRSCRVAGRGG